MNELLYETDEYEVLSAVLEQDNDGARLDVAIAMCFDAISRNRAQLLIEKGDVSVNEEVITSKKHQIKQGDKVEVRLLVRVPLKVEPENIDLSIVYEDDDIIVIDKEKGMVVHPAPGNETGTLVNALLYHMKNAGESLPVINGELRPGIVHRIDKNTSGLLVVAKNNHAHAFLSEQLAAHSMKRVYYALVSGGFKDVEGTIDADLARDPVNRKKQKVVPNGFGRTAITHYKVIEKLGQYSLLELKLETGRTHQIRAHLNYIKHPVLGDDLYGSAAGSGQFLHAGVLGLIHPTTKEYVEFTSKPHAEFSDMLEMLRRKAEK